MDSRYFGLKLSSGGSSPTSLSSRRSEKKGSSSGPQDMPKPPQRGLGVAQLERLRLQDQLFRSHLNHIGPFGSSNLPLHNPNQGNQWSFESGYSSPPFTFSSPSSSPPPSEYQSNKMMKFGDIIPSAGVTSEWNPNAPISNMATRPLQNEQGGKDRVQEDRDADWLILSLGSISWAESEADEDQELDLELKLRRVCVIF